jgi:hypothetical protein
MVVVGGLVFSLFSLNSLKAELITPLHETLAEEDEVHLRNLPLCKEMSSE